MPRPRKTDEERRRDGTMDRKPGPGPSCPVQALPGDFDPPKHLTSGAKTLWRRLAPGLIQSGRLGVGDLVVFEEYCRSFDEVRRHTARIQREGWVRKNSNDTVSPHPLVAVRDKAAKLVADLAKALGLTPVHRKNVAREMEAGKAPAAVAAAPVTPTDDGSVAGLGARPSPRLVG